MDYLNKECWRKIALFLLFVVILSIKAIAFHYFAFHTILISSLWKHPAHFWLFYAKKISFPIILGSLVFLFKKHWWTIVVMIIADVWCISNLIYFKIFDSFLTIDAIFMASNMAGGWSSILAYINYQEAFFLFSTALFVIPLFIMGKKEIQWHSHWIFFSSVFAIWLAQNNGIMALETKLFEEIQLEIEFESYNGKSMTAKRFFNASFPEIMGLNQVGYSHIGSKQYVSNKSIISYFPASIMIYADHVFIEKKKSKITELTSTEINEILTKISKSNNSSFLEGSLSTPNQLILILVESLESWIFEKDIDNNIIMPNLKKLIEDEHSLYYHKIKSQTLAGNSGDGQMIINTGLLPISQGVACMNYSDNVYPNLAYYFSSSTIINPWRGIWNQDIMTERYSFKSIVQPEDNTKWNDEQVISRSISVCDSSASTNITQIITVSSHAPFNSVKKDYLSFSNDTPKILRSYFNCLHYTDEQIGILLTHLRNDEKYNNTAIVVTGDHTIFKSSMQAEFLNFTRQNGLSIENEPSYCPLIIYYPPLIHENKKVMDTECYQMDIFPTIQQLIGDTINPWRGLGVNLLDSCSVKNRNISEDEAYKISDQIIRSDFFRQYSNLIKR